MKKKIPHEELLLKISSTAYCFKELEYYGSKEKALKALLKRKGFEGYSTHTATNQFEQALKVITDTREFVDAELPDRTLAHMAREEIDLFMCRLKEALSRKNPRAPKEMLQYALNWIYMNYYLR